MKIGYLHIGPPKHGVVRYGYLLAAEARRRSELEVIEANVILTEDKKKNYHMLIEAARKLSKADIIHFQFNKFNQLLWGGGWVQLDYLGIFLDRCSSPLVVTLHDVFYPPYGLAGMLKYISSKLQPQTLPSHQDTKITPTGKSSKYNPSFWTRGWGFAQSTFLGTFGSEALALRKIASRVSLILVCTKEESKRLRDRVDNRKLKTIPHFVETRSIALSRSQARTMLGLDGVKVVTLLGYIYATKGHQILVEAMSKLPQEVMVVFAGGASHGSQQVVEELMTLAKEKGVDQRLRITGYLSEQELEHYLIATDLAVCPFSRFSASGSLSTWISVARPILASDFPQVAEYNRLEPDAIETFKPYTPIALAEVIRQMLPKCRENNDFTVANLQQKLSLPVIFDKHLACYLNVQR